LQPKATLMVASVSLLTVVHVAGQQRNPGRLSARVFHERRDVFAFADGLSDQLDARTDRRMTGHAKAQQLVCSDPQPRQHRWLEGSDASGQREHVEEIVLATDRAAGLTRQLERNPAFGAGEAVSRGAASALLAIRSATASACVRSSLP
jgi:hypothetical protein